ncbi:hypothetical protein FQR65_LT16799 [Abscondita terminalis]|nr:hypothetical protein FQR65_LT16799 [Abscondita terminalis]
MKRFGEFGDNDLKNQFDTRNPIECKIEIDEMDYDSIKQENVSSKLLIMNENEIGKNVIKMEDFSENEHYMLLNTDVPFFIEERSVMNDFYYCYVCNYCTNSKENLTYHIFTHQFKCNLCKYEATDNFLLAIHKETHLDNKLGLNSYKRAKHFSNKKIKNLFECYNCGYQTSNKTTLTFHIATHRKYTTFFCNVCNYGVHSKMALKYHMLKHSTIQKNISSKVHECEKCTFTTSTKENLHRHVVSIHDREKLKHKCEFCNYATFRKYQLLAHVRKHIGQAAYKCNLCHGTFKSSWSLKAHLNKHYDSWRYKCDKCDFKTNGKSYLMNHQLLHIGKKRYTCKLCEYGSMESRNLKLHMLKHGGKFPYNCDQCDYKTAYKNSLINHQRLHSQEKPFKCEFCDYRGREMRRLQSHMFKHTGNWPYKCDECTFKTDMKNKFLNHKKIHIKNKPYKCKVCGRGYTHRRTLRLHEERPHATSR